MAQKIVILQGQPNPFDKLCGHALADTYAKGAKEANHEVKREHQPRNVRDPRVDKKMIVGISLMAQLVCQRIP